MTKTNKLVVKLVVCVFSMQLMLALLPYRVYAAAQEASTGLSITNVSTSGITANGATISWNTSANATSQVFYDTTYHDNITDYAHYTNQDLTLVTVHSMGLSGLTAATVYHFRVKSTADKITAVSDDSRFTTATGAGGGGGGGGGGGSGTPPGVTYVSEYVNSSGTFTKSATAKSVDGNVRLDINKDTIGLADGRPLSSISISMMEQPPAAPPVDSSIVGLTYNLGPDNATFDPSISLVFTYDPTKIPPGFNEKDLVIGWWDKGAGRWSVLEGGMVDTITHTITAPLSHFTVFTVLAYKSPTLTASNLTISPREVSINENVNISVVIANTGNLSGTQKVTLKINNILIGTKEVTVAGGARQTVTFTTTQDSAGIYNVNVDGLSGTFTVKASPIITTAPSTTRSTSGINSWALTISPHEVNINENVTISVLITATGNLTGTQKVTLRINDIVVAIKDVTMAGGASQTVTFTTTQDSAGIYKVNVDGLSGTFIVKALPIITTAPSIPAKPVDWSLIVGMIAGIIVMAVVIWLMIRHREA